MVCSRNRLMLFGLSTFPILILCMKYTKIQIFWLFIIFSSNLKNMPKKFFCFFENILRILFFFFCESLFCNDFAGTEVQGIESWYIYSDKLRLMYQRFATCCTIIMNSLSVTIYITSIQCFQQKGKRWRHCIKYGNFI